ncbi:MAG: SRPBCC domain-containing protein [Elusimicrobia bacterium]|nr:SRPBCC domain-containing protein [Elusimicrobiota bacterium]
MTLEKKTKPEPESARELVIRRVIDAPRERVWRAWADPEEVVRWWGPYGFADEPEVREFRPGGVWRHVMIGPDGKRFPNFARFLEIAEPERIVWSHGGSEEGGPPIAGFIQTVTFKDLGNGKTELTMRSVFPSAASRDEVAEKYGAVEGGRQTLQRLAEHATGGRAFVLDLSRLIDAPLARVWEAWADPEQVERWFAPRPLTLEIERMDLRAGGGFAMTMRFPDGKAHPFSGVYREVVERARIVWTGEFRSDPKDNIRTEVSFADEGGKTRLTVRQTFAVLTPVNTEATKGARRGWTMTLDQLAEHAAG